MQNQDIRPISPPWTDMWTKQPLNLNHTHLGNIKIYNTASHTPCSLLVHCFMALDMVIRDELTLPRTESPMTSFLLASCSRLISLAIQDGRAFMRAALAKASRSSSCNGAGKQALRIKYKSILVAILSFSDKTTSHFVLTSLTNGDSFPTLFGPLVIHTKQKCLF